MDDIVSSIVNDFSDRLFTFINRIVRDRDEALDLTQDTFVNVLRRPGRPQEIAKLKAYLYKTAYNLALNAIRDRQRRIAKSESVKNHMFEKTAQQPDELFESDRSSMIIQEALDNLSSKQREAVMLRFYGDMKFSEIAENMSITEGSAKIHVARGLQKLAGQLSYIKRKEIL